MPHSFPKNLSLSYTIHAKFTTMIFQEFSMTKIVLKCENGHARACPLSIIICFLYAFNKTPDFQ